MSKIEELQSWNKFYADGMDKFHQEINRIILQITKNCSGYDLHIESEELEAIAEDTQHIIDSLEKEMIRYAGYAERISINQKEIVLIQSMKVPADLGLEKMPDNLCYEDHTIYADYLLRPSILN